MNLHFCIFSPVGCTTWNIWPNLSLCLLRWTPCGFHSDPIWREANKSNIPIFKVLDFNIYLFPHNCGYIISWPTLISDKFYVVIVRRTDWLRSSGNFLNFQSAQCNNVTTAALNSCYINNATQCNSSKTQNIQTNKEYSWSSKSKKTVIDNISWSNRYKKALIILDTHDGAHPCPYTMF